MCSVCLDLGRNHFINSFCVCVAPSLQWEIGWDDLHGEFPWRCSSMPYPDYSLVYAGDAQPAPESISGCKSIQLWSRKLNFIVFTLDPNSFLRIHKHTWPNIKCCSISKTIPGTTGQALVGTSSHTLKTSFHWVSCVRCSASHFPACVLNRNQLSPRSRKANPGFVWGGRKAVKNSL